HEQFCRLTCSASSLRMNSNQELDPMGASVQAGLPAPPDSFSAQERFLIEKTEEAIHDGRQLEEWIRARDRNHALRLFPLDLKKTYRVPNRAEGFLDTLVVN